ncbi:MAG: carbohydrate ABC transporter permease [Nakamurella sp.]
MTVLTVPPRRRSRRGGATDWRRPTGLNRAGSILLILVYGFPLYWLIITSLKSDGDILRHPAALISSISFDAYHGVLGSDLFIAMGNSFIIAAGTTVLTGALAVLAAHALSRVRGPAPSLLLGVLILLQMVPPAAAVIPLYRILGGWHLLNSLTGVVLADTAGLLPFAIMLLRPFFLAIPQEIEEAAAVDGAGYLRTFRSIVLPMVHNGLTTVATLVFMIAWGDFLYSITFLNSPTKYPLTALLAQQLSQTAISFNRLMAISVLGALPIVVLFLFTARRLTEGLALGTSK